MSVSAVISQAIQDATGYSAGVWSAFFVTASFGAVLAVSIWILVAVYGGWAANKLSYSKMVRCVVTLAIILSMVLAILAV